MVNFSLLVNILVDAKHLASIKMLTDLTYLPDLTIDEILDWMVNNRLILFESL